MLSSSKTITFFLLFFAFGCASQWNTVRTNHDEKANQTIITLESNLYVNVDGNRMREMLKGERRLTISFKRTQNAQQKSPVALKLQLYPTDAKPHLQFWIGCINPKTKFPLVLIKSEPLEETVTVLDVDDRDNPNLSPDTLSQTSDINFGKPVTASAVNRRWVLYTLNMSDELALLKAVDGCSKAQIEFQLGDKRAVAEAGEKEIAAWKAYKAT
ncbi:MAG TPA: hypothetical protein PLY93_14175 [Turneriella sp.]|nr:hypothetical protein [Turneriella sp.]